MGFLVSDAAFDINPHIFDLLTFIILLVQLILMIYYRIVDTVQATHFHDTIDDSSRQTIQKKQ